MSKLDSPRKRRKRGHAVMEVAMMAPWIFFLFSGALDMGFYEVALVSTQNAARSAAEFTSRSTIYAADQSTACTYALQELQSMSNVRSLSSCGASPLVVTASLVTGADGNQASQVTVTYTSNLMIPIPWIMRQLTVSRTVQMRLKSV